MDPRDRLRLTLDLLDRWPPASADLQLARELVAVPLELPSPYRRQRRRRTRRDGYRWGWMK